MRLTFHLSKPTALQYLGAAFIWLPFVLYGWHRLDYASSPAEIVAIVRLEIAVKEGATDIALAATMPGNWERVCYIHPYGVFLNLPHYNKLYYSRAYPNDDGWDLVFIDADGTHRAASGQRPLWQRWLQSWQWWIPMCDARQRTPRQKGEYHATMRQLFPSGDWIAGGPQTQKAVTHSRALRLFRLLAGSANFELDWKKIIAYSAALQRSRLSPTYSI